MKARIPNFLSLIALSCFAIASLAPAARGEDPKAQWVWLGGGEESQKVAFRKSFEVGGDVKQARIAATCDNVFQLFLNGQPVLSGDSWNRLESVDVTAKLKPGKNTLAALGTDEGGLAGFILRMDVVDKSGKVMTLVTDASWKGASAATPLAANWNSAGFDDASWKAVAIKGAVGAGNLPWSDSVDAAALAVAPVVNTSSISKTARPSTGAAGLARKAPWRLSALSLRVRPNCGRVRFTLFRARAATSCLLWDAIASARRAAWLNRRLNSLVQWSGTGTSKSASANKSAPARVIHAAMGRTRSCRSEYFSPWTNARAGPS